MEHSILGGVLGNCKLATTVPPHVLGEMDGWLGCGTAGAIRNRASNGDDGKGGWVGYLI